MLLVTLAERSFAIEFHKSNHFLALMRKISFIVFLTLWAFMPLFPQVRSFVGKVIKTTAYKIRRLEKNADICKACSLLQINCSFFLFLAMRITSCCFQSSFFSVCKLFTSRSWWNSWFCFVATRSQTSCRKRFLALNIFCRGWELLNFIGFNKKSKYEKSSRNNWMMPSINRGLRLGLDIFILVCKKLFDFE